MSISLSVLETGTIRIRPSHRTQSATKPVLLRRAKAVFGDKNWTEPLPINTYLINHPDGPILFDTGESPHANAPGWLPRWQSFFHRAVDINVAPEEGIGARLAQQGIKPQDLQAVVVSHLHHDHGDGLGDLADARRILVTDDHWDFYRKPLRATIEGAVPQHWPTGFQPELLHLTGPALGPWEKTYPITADGKVVGVPTPGHVPGHLSVVVFGDDATYFLGGDVTYDQALLDQEKTDGVNNNPKLAVEQLRKIKEFARMQPIVLLPAHDPGTSQRLANNEVYVPSPLRD
ncbi:N-acyl homoserine lactonase family protein [Glutamicibacter sp. AOP5-A2-18]|uniref:N-acyl homoserine lactonase family protein n=1 Tax=Glutamicibacter sp. AOP5-A2-18 TaxID=3457656 RepID=UPI004033B0BE